jgi:hypothetical protein
MRKKVKQYFIINPIKKNTTINNNYRKTMKHLTFSEHNVNKLKTNATKFTYTNTYKIVLIDTKKPN